MGAEISARHAREEARKAVREVDRAEAEAWSIRMEGYGGPSQPSPTIAQCLNGGMGWLEVECYRCKTRASLSLDAIRRPRHTPIWKPCSNADRAKGTFRTAHPHDQADRNAKHHALQMGASDRGALVQALR